MFKKSYCGICGKEKEPRVPLVKKYIYVNCDETGYNAVEMNICDSCNYRISNAGLIPKVKAEVEMYKKLKFVK